MIKTKIQLLSLLLLPLIGASCNLFSQASGGIWFSPDGGENWEQRSEVAFQGAVSTLNNEDILDLQFSATDTEIGYAATEDRGLYKTENRAESWFPVTTQGVIQAVDIHRLDAEKVVAARDDQIFLTTDGAETWKLVYTNPSTERISDIAFDANRESVIFATLTTGDILRSDNLGRTWTSVARFEQPAVKILSHPRSASRVYVLTTGEIHRSDTNGDSWEKLTDPIQTPIYRYPAAISLIDLQTHPSDPDLLIVSTKNGLYQSQDGGQIWKQLPLLTKTEADQLYTFGWDPHRVNVLYYASQYVFYKSENRGQSWQTIPFPQGLVPRDLIIHPANPNELFLGTISL